MNATNATILIVMGLALVLLFGAMLWNIYRPAKGWRDEWREITQANAERAEQMRIEKRLRMVGR